MTNRDKGPGSQLGAEALASYFADDTRQQLDIATQLEDLADRLPARPEPRAVARLLAGAAPSWASHRSFQEDFLFPLLLRRCEGNRETSAQFDLLRADHLRIEGCNSEVIEQLSLAISGIAPNPDMLGYLLRNAFEARRRHVEWEGAVVTKLLPRVLAPVERDMFETWIGEQPPDGPS